jgi:hypothetical protein
MRLFLATAIGAGILWLSGCSLTKPAEYPIEVKGQKANAYVSFGENGISGYSIDFDGPKYKTVWMMSRGRYDKNKNGVPDIDVISVRCEVKQPFNRNVNRAAIYLMDEKGWYPDAKPAECILPKDAEETAMAAEKAVIDAVWKKH